MKFLILTLAALLAAIAASADTAHEKHAMEMTVAVAGDIEITGAFARATLPNQPAGGGFMTITNNGTEDDRLIAVETAVAGTSGIHEMSTDGEVMRMRELPDGLEIPAGETVNLEPGGYHLMLMGLNMPLVEGEKFVVTLTFEKAGTVEVTLDIGPRDAKGHGHGD